MSRGQELWDFYETNREKTEYLRNPFMEGFLSESGKLLRYWTLLEQDMDIWRSVSSYVEIKSKEHDCLSEIAEAYIDDYAEERPYVVKYREMLLEVFQSVNRRRSEMGKGIPE